MRARTMDPAGIPEAERLRRLAFLGFIPDLAGGGCGISVALVTWLPMVLH
jgi:hypothetical protein